MLQRSCFEKIAKKLRGRGAYCTMLRYKRDREYFYRGGRSIGPGSVLWTTRANILIDEKVITGPHITIITGNHRTNIPGKFMADVTAAEKEPSDDEDVIIKRDVWIGANATILKGVTIEEGCVIAAGAVVTRSTEPFGIYAGVPASRIAERFDQETLVKHKELMQE